MPKKDDLTKEQKIFITSKVEELGSYKAVAKFYNRKDMVSAFAKQTAIEVLGIDDDDDYEEKPKKQKKKSKKPKTVKRKRKINVDEVLDDGEE